MIKSLAFASLFATLAGFADAECANACNGHGKCTSYDMCICNRNWQANDCSERVCLYGLAHVDTPKGDLDMSGSISNSDTPVVDNHMTYPYGTTEQFPEMRDSDLNTILNSAHQYMECSNKGKCDRESGDCSCYDGYEGVSCQRASCPGYPDNTCSGHGTCKTIKQLAAKDNSVYELWDKDLTMGCDCDAGYYGADCTQRTCKVGIDPLYLDDSSTVKYSVYNFATLSTSASGVMFTDGLYASTAEGGEWAIRFFDSHGEDWVTRAIPSSATCAQVKAALEALPNDVIPGSTIYCDRLENSPSGGTDGVSQTLWNTTMDDGTVSPHTLTVNYNMGLWDSYGFTPKDAVDIDATDTTATFTPRVRGFVYRIRFLGNPGALKQPEIEIYLDGVRPSLSTLATTAATVITKVWTDGQQGENTDYFADHCDGVTATITGTVAASGSVSGVTLAGMSATELALLKTCLGAADFTTTNNVDIYDWDFGTIYHPHLIKLVRTVTTYTDGGYYAAIYWDGSTFQVINPFISPDTLATDNYEIYTTKGTLSMVSSESEAVFSFASNKIYMTNSTNDRNGILVGGAANGDSMTYTGDVSCEVGDNNAGHLVSGLLKDKVDSTISTCLNSTNIFTFLNTQESWNNPPYINLYTATSLKTTNPKYAVKDVWASTTSGSGSAGGALDDASDSLFMTHVITTDIATNWEAHTKTDVAISQSPFRLYKFWPSTASQYTYVAECSNRGLCNTESGLCECFPGYTSDSCHEQSSISL
jgi:hypothetical protein